ncbi:MAG: molybdopterin-dependent oxidoreductase [Desulfobacter sp.]|nr:MAG: molybdopterin-dependent oxidoreductase [Desulfobacter sp.]
MEPHAETFNTLDINFKEDGPARFTGIRLSRLAKMAGMNPHHPLTVVGSDQYVGYLPGELLGKGFLVWEINGKKITGLKGGPLKVVFPQQLGVHPACFTWYVEAMVAGSGTEARLSLVHRDTVRQYSRKELEALATPLDPSLFSIAQGCRNSFPSLPGGKEILAVPLSRLLAETLAEKGGAKVAVELVPFAGPVVTLPPDIARSPAYVVISCDGRPLHPALGGPFSVIFPVETHPEMADLVPESGALFFIEKVIIQ